MKHLVILDFDGTIAATFEPSLNHIDVNIASRKAIRQVFGEVGLKEYDAIGGLRGREPGELIAIMQSHLALDLPNQEVTQAYIDAKLSVIIPEISMSWPRLLPGVWDFLRSVEVGDIPVDIAIVSSGHDEFIKKFFEVNGLTPPKNLVTSDALREHPQPVAERERSRYKPNPYQLALVHAKWERDSAVATRNWERPRGKSRMLYVGDDPIKDGTLAENSRIPFGFVPFTTEDFHPDHSKGQFALNDFSALTELLLQNEMKLASGQSFAHIVFKVPDYELFPSLDREFGFPKKPQEPEGAAKRVFNEGYL